MRLTPMLRSAKLSCCLFAINLLAMGLARTAWAAPLASVAFTETALPDGSWQYDYAFTNGSDPVTNPLQNLYAVSLEYPISAFVLDYGTATDWSALFDTNDVLFAADFAGVPPDGSEVAPGAVLGGFRLVFDERVGPSNFTAFLENPGVPGEPVIFQGTTTYAVSEPASSIPFAVGGVIWAFCLRRKCRVGAWCGSGHDY